MGKFKTTRVSLANYTCHVGKRHTCSFRMPLVDNKTRERIGVLGTVGGVKKKHADWSLLFSSLLFWGDVNKIPHNYPKDDYAYKSHGESRVRKQITFHEIHDAMKCSTK